MSEYHNPVLLKESVDALVLNPGGTDADATFGGGGHRRAAGFSCKTMDIDAFAEKVIAEACAYLERT